MYLNVFLSYISDQFFSFIFQFQQYYFLSNDNSAILFFYFFFNYLLLFCIKIHICSISHPLQDYPMIIIFFSYFPNNHCVKLEYFIAFFVFKFTCAMLRSSSMQCYHSWFLFTKSLIFFFLKVFSSHDRLI